MPAASEEVLFDYEANIEDPLATALASLMTGVQILTARTTQAAEEHKETPRVEIALIVSGSPEHHSKDRAGVEYRDTREGSLTFLCASTRGAAAGLTLGALCGKLRANLRKGKTLLNASNCPYYEIVWLEEAASQPQFDAENDEIQRVITADIQWWIKPDQFPTP